jgi:probable HAF family extracellular repeat protein
MAVAHPGSNVNPGIVVGHTFSTRSRLLWLGLAIVAFTTAPSAQSGLPATYTITDLGTLGGASSEATGINNLGEVVGASTTEAGATHAFLFRAGRMTDLGTLSGGTSSYATAINDAGEVVGYSGINSFGPQFREFTQGFVWRAGTVASMGSIYCPCTFNVRYGTSRAHAIANSGEVVGESQVASARAGAHAVLWREDLLYDLTAHMEYVQPSYAYGVNDRHQVAGQYMGRAFLMTDGIIADLGVLPGHSASTARALNNQGQVAGVSTNAAGTARAFAWDLPGMRDLGTLPRDTGSEALAMNVFGTIVGRSGAADWSVSRATVWQNGVAVDLNARVREPGWTLIRATGINDAGQIVGVAFRNGQTRAVLLTPR